MKYCIAYSTLLACLASCLQSCSPVNNLNDLAVATSSAPTAIRSNDTLEIEITVTNRNVSESRRYIARLDYDVFGTALGGISQTQTSTVQAGSTDKITFKMSMAEVSLTNSDKEFQPQVDITYQDDHKTVSVGHSFGQITIEK